MRHWQTVQGDCCFALCTNEMLVSYEKSLSSYNWKHPEDSTCRSRIGSMGFVNASATCRAVGIHRKWHCSWQHSRVSKTSRWCGILRMMGSLFYWLGHIGSCNRWRCLRLEAVGNLITPLKVIYAWCPRAISSILNGPTPFDMEKASADSVDLATQEIFFDIQDSGLMGALWFLSRSWFVAKKYGPLEWR